MTQTDKHSSHEPAADRSTTHVSHMFELRGAASQETAVYFMQTWKLLADLAVTDAARDRAIRHHTDWSMVAPSKPGSSSNLAA